MMSNEGGSPVVIEASDTQRPPPCPPPRKERGANRSKRYPVTVSCETEEQRHRLHEWLRCLGFETVER
jgi:hypothetical protein